MVEPTPRAGVSAGRGLDAGAATRVNSAARSAIATSVDFAAATVAAAAASRSAVEGVFCDAHEEINAMSRVRVTDSNAVSQANLRVGMFIPLVLACNSGFPQCCIAGLTASS